MLMDDFPKPMYVLGLAQLTPDSEQAPVNELQCTCVFIDTLSYGPALGKSVLW